MRSIAGRKIAAVVLVACTLLLSASCLLLSAPPAHATSYINTAVPSNPNLKNGLVGQWTFDGKNTNWNTNRTNDLSGQGNTGTLVSMSTTSSPVVGKIGQALKFNGVSGYVGNFSTSISPVGSARTICAWIKTSSSVRQGIAATRNDDINTGFGFTINRTTAGNLTYYHTGGTTLETAAGITIGKWYHVCASLVPSTTATLYVNGNFLSSSGVTAEGATSYNGIVGAEWNGSLFNPFTGSIDDVRIYNRALSAGEVTRLYQLGATSYINTAVPSNPSLMNGLVGQWTFDGKDMVPNARDVSGQGNHGNLIGFTSTTTAIGKIGQALKFNGTNQYVSVPYTNTDFERTDPFSFSVWAKWGTSVPAGGSPTFIGRSSATSKFVAFAHCINAGASFCNANSVALWLYGTSQALYMSTATNSVLPPSAWTHIVATYDGSSTPGGVRIYINGVNMALTTHQNSLASSIKSSLNWRIGDDYTSDYFSGSMDDVRIYNRVLSAGEVARLYQLGATSYINTAVPSNPSLMNGLVGQWTFDGKDMIPNARDASGQGNHGNLIGFTSTTTAIGKIGQALKFNGTSSVTMGNISQANFGTSNFTIAYWIYMTTAIDGSVAILNKRATCSDVSFWDIRGNNLEVDQGGGTLINYGNVAAGVGADSRWHQVVFTRAGATLTAYKDGVFANSASTGGTTNISNSASFLISNDICIGHDTTTKLNGKLDDVRIYNRALSAAEILRLYQLGN